MYDCTSSILITWGVGNIATIISIAVTYISWVGPTFKGLMCRVSSKYFLSKTKLAGKS